MATNRDENPETGSDLIGSHSNAIPTARTKHRTNHCPQESRLMNVREGMVTVIRTVHIRHEGSPMLNSRMATVFKPTLSASMPHKKVEIVTSG